MYFSIWSIPKAKVSTKKYQTVNALEIALRREWGKISSDHTRVACDAIIRAEDGYIEQ